MRTHIFKLSIIIVLLVLMSCKKSWLDVTPLAAVDQSALVTPTNADALVNAGYAQLANQAWNQWAHGAVRGDNAYKGGAGPADGAWNPAEMINLITPTFNAGAWTGSYNSIYRFNAAINVLNQLTDAQMPTRTVRMAEMRFLRGVWHFNLKRLYKYPVYITDSLTIDDMTKLSNRAYTSDQLWDKIAADLKYAYDNLPATQTQPGRANKYAAAAFLAETRLYQAYEQDENHNVININQTKLQQVVTMCDVVINSNKYSLFDNFGKNFTYGYDNGVESIFAIQYSNNDGSTRGKNDNDHFLNYNMAPGYGCCGFSCPSQNLVNAFKTVNGLPTDTYNSSDLRATVAADFQTNTVDSRLDHTVGIPGHPFKYALNFVYANNWARTPSIYGYFSTMKECQLPTSPSFKPSGAYFYSSKNIDYMRYDDVLLMKAEALIELGQQNAALPIINQIRTRAANTTWLKYADNTTFSNYNIATYQDGVNCTWTQAFARNALRWERRLEFAMEDTRFYDLVRWGVAAETMNAYFAVEKTKRSHLSAAGFRKNQDEYYPIPQAQITLSNSLYVQNTGAWGK